MGGSVVNAAEFSKSDMLGCSKSSEMIETCSAFDIVSEGGIEC